jgi:hypothetical protein
LDELVKLVSEKENLSNDQARAAVNAVVDFLNSKLPAPIAAQITGLLGESGPGGLGGVAKGLGGMLGQR